MSDDEFVLDPSTSGAAGANAVNDEDYDDMPDLLSLDLPESYAELVSHKYYEYDPYTDSLLLFHETQLDHRGRVVELLRVPLHTGAASNPGRDLAARELMARVAAAGVVSLLDPGHNSSIITFASRAFGLRGGRGALVSRFYHSDFEHTHKVWLALFGPPPSPNGDAGEAGTGDTAKWVQSGATLTLDGLRVHEFVVLRYPELPCDYFLLSAYVKPTDAQIVWMLFDDSLRLIAHGEPFCASPLPAGDYLHHAGPLFAGPRPGEIAVLGQQRDYEVRRCCVLAFPPAVVARMRAGGSSCVTIPPGDYPLAASLRERLELHPVVPAMEWTLCLPGSKFVLFGEPIGGPNTTFVAVTGSCTVRALGTFAAKPAPAYLSGGPLEPSFAPCRAPRPEHVLVPVGKPETYKEESYQNCGRFDDEYQDEGDDETEEFYGLRSIPAAGCIVAYSTKRHRVFRVALTPWSREFHAGGWTGRWFRSVVRAWLGVRTCMLAADGTSGTPAAATTTAAPATGASTVGVDDAAAAAERARAMGLCLARLPPEVFETLIAAHWDVYQGEHLMPRHKFLHEHSLLPLWGL